MSDKFERFFKAVGDPTRRRLMTLLRKKEMCVTDLCAQFEMSQPTISHHLGILKNAGIVNSRKDGKVVYYRLDCCQIEDCCGGFMKKFN